MTQTPKQSRPSSPAVETEEASARKPVVGAHWAAAYFLPRRGELLSEDEVRSRCDRASEQKPYPAPKFVEEPRATPDAEFRRAAEEDSLRQMEMGIKEGFPSLAQLVVTQLRCIVAGGLVGAWDGFGGIGPQMANLANVAFVAFASNQESAAKLHESQNAEWHQLARDRRELSKVKQKPTEPCQPKIIRTLAGRQKAYGVRTRKPFSGETKFEPECFQNKRAGGRFPLQKG